MVSAFTTSTDATRHRANSSGVRTATSRSVHTYEEGKVTAPLCAGGDSETEGVPQREHDTVPTVSDGAQKSTIWLSG